MPLEVGKIKLKEGMKLLAPSGSICNITSIKDGFVNMIDERGNKFWRREFTLTKDVNRKYWEVYEAPTN